MERLGTDVIAEMLDQAKEEELPGLIARFLTDERKSVQKLAQKSQKKLDDLEKERKRMYDLFAYERKYQDYQYICGIDEAGRGPWVGPVVAGAVILPKNCDILYINDSKKLSEKKREELYDVICEKAVAYAVGVVSEKRIDEINILNATKEAMAQAIAKLNPQPDFLLIDSVRLSKVNIPQDNFDKGDALSASIGAASIIAKVTRDRMLREIDELYPEYHFAKNKGYGTKEHIDALAKYGPTPIHRMSFIKNYI